MEYMNLSLSLLLPIPLELITSKTLLHVMKEVVNLYVSTILLINILCFGDAFQEKIIQL